MVNSKLIRKRIDELGYTQNKLAEKLNISPSVLSQKLNNTRPIYLDQLKIIADELKIRSKDYDKYFFA